MSEDANIGRKCERCGAPLAPDVPEGLCPRCLMALNLATQTEAPGAEIGPEGTKVVPQPPQPPPPLEEISRRFPQLEILESLGRGGMGVVYKARQPRLNRFVALKILAPEKEKEPRFAERFTREAQALARLNHPNIVAVYDFGEVDGLYYLLMEFVDGMNLRQLLQTRKLAPEEALTIVPSICEALQFAHQLGIVHRDIKPENILLDKQGRVKIADFGIAKMLGEDGRAESLTGEQGVVGTPHYMAPEQVERPAIVDHRADIFSLGVVFYEMLTGELPLGKFAPPSRRVKMDVRLDEVVLHALEKEPERRYQQASQVKSDVETIVKTETGQTQASRAQTERTPPAAASAADNAFRQVRAPAIGLIVTSILSLIAVPVSFFFALLIVRWTHGDALPLVLLPLFALVLSCVLLVAGLKMKRLQAYGLAIAGAILAILITPANLIGLPIGVWALVILSQRHVREAFGKGHVVPRFPAAQPAGAGSAWKVTAIVVAAVMIALAIPVGAILLAIWLPAYTRASQRARVVAAQIRHPAPSFVIHGTVTDSTTGQPIAGARVDDNDYGTRANRPPQQAWTDAQGHYELRTWNEEHTLSASAPGYQTKTYTFIPGQSHGDFSRSSSQMPVSADALSSYSSITNRLAELKRQETELLMQYTESYPLVTNMRDRIGKLTQQKGDLEKQYPRLASAQTDLEQGEAQPVGLSAGAMPAVQQQIERVQSQLRDTERKLHRQQSIARAQGAAGGAAAVVRGIQRSAQVDFQLEPAENTDAGSSDPEAQALNQMVKRGSEAWNSSDFSRALGLLLPAALKGSAVAQHRVGVMYLLGQGVDPDYAEATRWFRKAAEQGQGESQYSLGLRYQLGQSVAQDYEEAARWFRLAADQGIGAAAAALAKEYAKGEGVPQDLVEAYKWAAVASRLPDPNNGVDTLREVESQLTPQQLAQAKALSKEFTARRVGPADP